MSENTKYKTRDTAVEHILFYIDEHNLKAHDKLPSEREMCELWQFNRTTLRNAIFRLIQEGVLYSKVGSGTFIAPPKLERTLQDLKTLHQHSQEAKRNVTTQVLSQQIVIATKQLSKQLKVLLGEKLFELKRIRYIDEVPAIIESSYVPLKYVPNIDTIDFSAVGFYNTLQNQYGLNIVNGTEKISITYADLEESELLEIAKATPLIYQTGIVYTSNDIPLEFFKAVVRSDIIRFSSRLTN